MEISLTAPLTDEEARSILGLKSAAYQKLLISGELVCTGSIREFPPCDRCFPTIIDILQYRLYLCVRDDTNAGLIATNDIDDVLNELVDRLEEGPPIPGGGTNFKGNLALDTVWLICRGSTRSAPMRLAATIARTLTDCVEYFSSRSFQRVNPN